MHPDDKVVKTNVKRLNATIKYPDLINGKPLDTQNNLKKLLELHNIVVKFNIMLRVREVTIPNIFHFEDEKENADLEYIYHISTISGMPNSRLDRHLSAIAWANAYHPIVESITQKPWDGIPRMNNFISSVKTKDQEYSHNIIRRWMISAIAAAHSKKGISSQGVLVFQGKQNLGKTKWVKSLDPLNCGAVKEGLLLDPSNKDSVITASQCWIGELGELDGTFRKSDIARIKSYITNSVDVIRSPYNARNSYFYRRTVFVATVNESNFLVDDTGNRRWWTVEVDSIDFDHKLDIQQVWAEVFHVWKSQNENTWLSDSEMNKLNEVNTEHELIDPFEEKFLSIFDFTEGWRNKVTMKITATDVLTKLGYDKPSKTDATRMGKIIIKHTNEKPKKIMSNRFHVLPLLKTDFKMPNNF